MIQLENESGGIGAARDYSPASNREFTGPVPAELIKALGRKPGTWSEIFPGTADEAFQAWHQSRYVNAIAEAGKRELNIPMYCNVWLAYPPGELPERHIATPGIGYPSGGPNQLMLPIWKAAAPAIDMIGPDLYSSDPSFVMSIMDVSPARQSAVDSGDRPGRLDGHPPNRLRSAWSCGKLCSRESDVAHFGEPELCRPHSDSRRSHRRN